MLYFINASDVSLGTLKFISISGTVLGLDVSFDGKYIASCSKVSWTILEISFHLYPVGIYHRVNADWFVAFKGFLNINFYFRVVYSW